MRSVVDRNIVMQRIPVFLLKFESSLFMQSLVKVNVEYLDPTGSNRRSVKVKMSLCPQRNNVWDWWYTSKGKSVPLRAWSGSRGFQEV